MEKYTIKVVLLANRLREGITGGNDGHTTTELGKLLTYTSRIENKE